MAAVEKTLLEFLRNVIMGAGADKAREYVEPKIREAITEMNRPEQPMTPGATMIDGYPSMSSGNAAITTPYAPTGIPGVEAQTLTDDQLLNVVRETAAENQDQLAQDRKTETLDFVKQYGSPMMRNAQRMLVNDVPKEVASDPEMQKGAVALSGMQALAASSDKAMGTTMTDRQYADTINAMPEPQQSQYISQFGAPVVGPQDVAVGQNQQPQQADEGPGFFESAGNFFKDLFGDEERMTRLALAFNSMRFEPDQGLAAVLGKRLESLSEQRDRRAAASQTGNQTMKLLSQYPDIQNAYMSGQIELKDALTYIQKMRRLELDEGAPAAFRALEARAKAAGLTPGTEAYNQFMINGGQRKGLALRVGKDGSIEISESGDLSSLTEAQSNALTFSQRMKASNLILNKVESAGTNLYDNIVNRVPLAGNYMISDEYRQYDQAKRDFINATLRKESGAAIAASEFDNADRQYFPVPGDTPQIIAQKRANRELAQKLIEANVPNVNKIVEASGADVGAGARTLQNKPAAPNAPAGEEEVIDYTEY